MCARIITKALIGMEDLSLGTSTFTRATSTGGTQTLHSIAGSVSVVGSINSQSNAANISAATLFTPTSSGLYAVQIAINTTRTATTSSTRPKVTIAYTDADNSQATSINALGPDSHNSYQYPDYVTVFIRALTGVAVTYATSGYLSSGATSMQYSVYLRALGPT